MKAINANPVRLSYVDEGNTAAPVIVLINSLGTDYRIWDQITNKLLPHYRVIRYDKRGHGLSDSTAPPYTIEDHVQDLTQLVAKLSLNNFILCGLSVGGMIAMSYAAAHPEHVKALVLSNTAHKIGPPTLWAERIKTVRENGIESISTAVMTRWFTDAYHAREPDQLAIWTNMLCRTPINGYIGTCEAIAQADFTAEVQTLSMPTLCIGGDKDGSTPPDLVQSTAALIPNATFKLITESGHIPSIEQPTQFIHHLTAFLEGNHLV